MNSLKLPLLELVRASNGPNSTVAKILGYDCKSFVRIAFMPVQRAGEPARKAVR